MKSSSPLSRRYSSCIQWLLVILLIGIVWAGLAYGIHRVMAGNTVGMDFHTFWQAARVVLFEQRDPYGDDVAVRSQLGVLRRLSTSQDDQMGFAYPLYALLPVFPLGIASFDWAQAIWLSFNILFLTVSSLFAFQNKRFIAVVFLLLVFPYTFGLLLGNFVILINGILILAFGIILFQTTQKKSLLFFLGFLLSWVTIKPQFVWLYITIVILSAFHKKQFAFLIGFLSGLIFFLIISFFIIPGWPTLWLERVGKYSQYMKTLPYGLLFSQEILPAWRYYLFGLVTLLASGITTLCIICWLKGQFPALLLVVWCGIFTYWLHPNNVAYSQTTFFLPMLIWLQTTQQSRWLRGGIGLSAIGISWIAFFLTRQYPGLPRIEELRTLFVLIWAIGLAIHFVVQKKHTQNNPLPLGA